MTSASQLLSEILTGKKQECGWDSHKRGNFRGHPGGQKFELPLTKATTLATGIPESNGQTGEIHMHTHFYSDQEAGSICRH